MLEEHSHCRPYGDCRHPAQTALRPLAEACNRSRDVGQQPGDNRQDCMVEVDIESPRVDGSPVQVEVQRSVEVEAEIG